MSKLVWDSAHEHRMSGSHWWDQVMVEEDELRAKITKLQIFISGEDFDKLSYSNRALLLRQLRLMIEYGEVLRHRLFLAGAV